MGRPRIVFGMNSLFAIRHLLPEILPMVRELGMEATVIAPVEPGEDPAPACHGVPFRAVPMKREIAPLQDLWALWRLWSTLRWIRPAITNMSTPKMGFLGGIAALLARVPHRIYTLRGLRYETTRSWKRLLLVTCEKIACRCAHQVICISRSVKETVLREGIVNVEKVVLLGERASEGIHIPDASVERASATTALRSSLGIPEGSSVLGFVGRLTRDKGIHQLVDCFRALRSEGRDVHLLLLGDFESGDPVDADMTSWIRTCPQVHWCGYVPDSAPYYPLMDVFLFPTFREGHGKVLLEAALAGKPAISSRVTGVIDVIVDGVTGILVPAGDSEALARAARRLLEDPALAARMGEAARKLVCEHFDNRVYLSRLGSMLQSLAFPEPVAAGFGK